MSRTFRRKEFSPSDIAKRGYLCGENDVWSHNGEPMWTCGWRESRRPSKSYEEYRTHSIIEFHRDAGNRYFVNYCSAPWEYRNRRNRSLRTTHRGELHNIFLDEEHEGELTPFTHTVGWDYW